jgi:hypothetical protein
MRRDEPVFDSEINLKPLGRGTTPVSGLRVVVGDDLLCLHVIRIKLSEESTKAFDVCTLS